MTPKIFTIQPKPTVYGGVKFRSRTEARWALFFDAMSIPFQYEFEGFDLRGGAYLPDFWLPDQKMFLEVKGVEPTEEEAERCAELTRASEADVLIAVGPPEERFGLIWFDREGRREETYVLAADTIAECGFWLLAESGGVSIGKNRTAMLPKGPMFSGALEDAYAICLSARFDQEDNLRKRRLAPLQWTADRKAAWWVA